MQIIKPEKRSRESYKKARNEFIERISDIEGIVSIYGTGKVSAPGISDIDFFLVVNEELDSEVLQEEFKQIKSKYRHFTHSPMVLTEDSFDYLDLISPYSYLRHREGKKLEKNSLKEYQIARQLVLFDLIQFKWFKDPLRYETSFSYRLTNRNEIKYLDGFITNFTGTSLPSENKVDLRHMLCRYNGLKHDKNLYEECFGNEITLESIIKIKNLRKNFDDRSIGQELLNELNLHVLADSKKLLRQIMNEQTIYTSPEKSSSKFIPDYNPKVGSTKWQGIEPKDMIKHSQEAKMPIQVLPYEIHNHIEGQNFRTDEAESYWKKKKEVIESLKQFKKRNTKSLLKPYVSYNYNKQYSQTLKGSLRQKYHKKVAMSLLDSN